MDVWIINCGSSTVKFHYYQMPEELLIIYGKVKKTRSCDSLLSFKIFAFGKASI
jgi:acetate kinase